MRLGRAGFAGVLRLDSTSDFGDTALYAGCNTRYGVAGQELPRRGSHPRVIKPFPVRASTAWFAWFYLEVWETDPFNGRRVKFANVSMMVAPTIVAVK